MAGVSATTSNLSNPSRRKCSTPISGRVCCIRPIWNLAKPQSSCSRQLSAVDRAVSSLTVFPKSGCSRKAHCARYRRQILALRHYFAGQGATVLLLDDLTSAQIDKTLHSIVHGVVKFEQFANDYGSERRRLIVLKQRGQAFRGGYHDFIIETGGRLSVSEAYRVRALVQPPSRSPAALGSLTPFSGAVCSAARYVDHRPVGSGCGVFGAPVH